MGLCFTLNFVGYHRLSEMYKTISDNLKLRIKSTKYIWVGNGIYQTVLGIIIELGVKGHINLTYSCLKFEINQHTGGGKWKLILKSLLLRYIGCLKTVLKSSRCGNITWTLNLDYKSSLKIIVQFINLPTKCYLIWSSKKCLKKWAVWRQ